MKVPWLKKETIAHKAQEVLSGYENIVERPVSPPIPVEDIIERYLGLRLSFEDLNEKLGTDDVLGATYVRSKLIWINERLFEKSSEGRLIFTCGHEAGHWVLHRRYVEAAGRLNSGAEAIVCRGTDSRLPIEWQADYFAACLLMPEKHLREAFLQACGEVPLLVENIKSAVGGTSVCIDPCAENWPLIAEIIREVGGFSNVSKEAIIIRLQELGLVINATGSPFGWKRSFSGR